MFGLVHSCFCVLFGIIFQARVQARPRDLPRARRETRERNKQHPTERASGTARRSSDVRANDDGDVPHIVYC